MSEPNYRITKWFSEDLLAIEMKKIKAKINKPIYLGFSILEISKTLMHDFGMIISNQNIKAMQNYVIWILTALLFTFKLKIFLEIMQKMLKIDMIHQIMKLIDHYHQE